MSGTSLEHRKSLPFGRPKSRGGSRRINDTQTEIGNACRRLELLALQGAVAAIFFISGVAKLTDGSTQWFRPVTAVIEIVGAIALAFPGLAALGALWLGFAMLCAAAMNLFVLHSSPMPAFSLGFLNALIIYARRDEIRALASRIRG